MHIEAGSLLPGSTRVLHHPELKPLTKILLVYGLPGAGKDELANALVDQYDWNHLSSSATLEILDGALPMLCINETRRRGDIVPDLIVNAGLTLRLFEFCECRPKNGELVLTGGLRTQKQAEEQLELACSFALEVEVLFLQCQPEVAYERITEGPERPGRTDDKPETVMKRIRSALASIEPINATARSTVGCLYEKGYSISYHTIDTTRLCKEEVALRVFRGQFDV